ncbi:MAG: hypothetical protein H6Q41_5914 [Deltaproteobacteria bacterium]|nr:hypothetical protein [Deltaproteobacteria bacterium]
MDFYCDAVPDLIFVHACPKFSHRTHVFMARREILIERETALYPRRQPFGNNLYVRAANGNSVNAH